MSAHKRMGTIAGDEESKGIYKKVHSRAHKTSTTNNKYGVLIKPIDDWDLLNAWA